MGAGCRATTTATASRRRPRRRSVMASLPPRRTTRRTVRAGLGRVGSRPAGYGYNTDRWLMVRSSPTSRYGSPTAGTTGYLRLRDPQTIFSFSAETQAVRAAAVEASDPARGDVPSSGTSSRLGPLHRTGRPRASAYGRRTSRTDGASAPAESEGSGEWTGPRGKSLRSPSRCAGAGECAGMIASYRICL